MESVHGDLLKLIEQIGGTKAADQFYALPAQMMESLLSTMERAGREILRLQSDNQVLKDKAESVGICAEHKLYQPDYFRICPEYMEQQIKNRLKEKLIDLCEQEGLITFIRRPVDYPLGHGNLIEFEARMRVHRPPAALQFEEPFTAPETEKGK